MRTLSRAFILVFLFSPSLIADAKIKRTFQNERYGYAVDYFTSIISDDMEIVVSKDKRVVEMDNIVFIAFNDSANNALQKTVYQVAKEYRGESGNSLAICKPEETAVEKTKINGLDAFIIRQTVTVSETDEGTGAVSETKHPDTSPIFLVDISSAEGNRSLLIRGRFISTSPSPGANEKFAIIKSVRKYGPIGIGAGSNKLPATPPD